MSGTSFTNKEDEARWRKTEHLRRTSATARSSLSAGAGYIGSHAVKALLDTGRDVVVFDNLSTGYRWAVGEALLIVGDLADSDHLDGVFAEHRFDAVLHFAAHIWVGESIAHPAKYYRNNVAASLNLFECVACHQVPHLVFSSTAAVYGEPDVDRLDETLPSAPINPYGASKMIAERMLTDIANVSGVTFAVLRYFNVAGAEASGRIGEATPDNGHIIKVACETALGLRSGMWINGTDYPTPDGTCVRDYIHVDDLAEAHVRALDYLESGGDSTVLNCGYGHGQSVREVLDMVKVVSGIDLPIKEGPRRCGDPPRLVADNSKIKRVLRWQPRHDDLRYIIKTAWDWENIWQERRARH